MFVTVVLDLNARGSRLSHFPFARCTARQAMIGKFTKLTRFEWDNCTPNDDPDLVHSQKSRLGTSRDK